VFADVGQDGRIEGGLLEDAMTLAGFPEDTPEG
jgi:hypothetical protein